MPTEKTRTIHVRRVKNPDDEDTWLDVERVDKLISSEGQGPGYKKTTRKMFWFDEGDDAAHPTRTLTEKRIENPEDEDTFVNLNIIDKLKTQRGQGPGYLKSTKKYVNRRELNQTREFTVRRVYHWDTNGDPNDTGGTNYERTAGTKDESQFVDVAVIEKLISSQGQGPGYKKRTFKFNTDPIKEFSEPAPDDVDLSKVVHLDPWQNIVNVQWKPPVEFVTITSSLFLIWQPTPEYIIDGGGLCSPSLGYTSLESQDTYLIHFEVSDADSPPTSISGQYVNGEFTSASGDEVTGLNWPFPISIDLNPWEFVGTHIGAPNVPVLRMQWEDNETGAIIVDRKGNPVEAFSGEPFRRGDTATFNVKGQAFTSGPQCWQKFGGPGGDVPQLTAFVETIVGFQLVTVIPGTEQSLNISSISVEYEGETFQGCGYYAGGSDLQIICEKVT